MRIVPKGELALQHRVWELSTTDQLLKAEDYKPLLVAYKNGGAVVLSDVANVMDSVEDIRVAGIANGKPAILVIINRQPGANIIDTVDRVRALLPQLRAAIPAAIDLSVVLDRSITIRASVEDVQYTLMISVGLVILVVFIFLRSVRTTIIPSVAVPVSLVGTFAVMYLLGYSVDNLSLMALTIATGFVVDDAIVVIENITRYLEQGMGPMQAALRGAKEIGFTVLSISISLVAVFIPILMMGGIVGRLFREFAVTLSAAILISLVVSLTCTPMMCAKLLRSHEREKHGRIYRANEWGFRQDCPRLRNQFEVGAAASAVDAAGHAFHHSTHHLSVRDHPERVFPAAGHRTAIRADYGRSSDFVPGHARTLASDCERGDARSGGGQPECLHRRFRRFQQRHQHRHHVYYAQIAQRA